MISQFDASRLASPHLNRIFLAFPVLWVDHMQGYGLRSFSVHSARHPKEEHLTYTCEAVNEDADKEQLTYRKFKTPDKGVSNPHQWPFGRLSDPLTRVVVHL